ncbi:histidine kinase [Jeotgalibacillus malaysiensis]|uniref:histidine kinase n=1 Tax=Jeotgalibacillus malaysiensis TaxID=1508404 RepID=A0A0B5APV0_9BACL|nr:histidine kinase [Jeotgalibacillus malaysiensis]AJD92126.1 histidine kinase [Jeotgalibacillus malaysiensis]
MVQRLKKYNTLRNQISIVFLIVMVIVLAFVAVSTYHFGGQILRDNAERQLKQTAVQASGKTDTLYGQIDLLTTQVATNQSVQQLLTRLYDGEEATFQQRQSLLTIGNTFQAYSDGIQSFEMYSAENERLFPLDDTYLFDRVAPYWVVRADYEQGRQIWVGQDPQYPNSLLAIRRISLIERSFASGGYLVIRIDPNYFRFSDGERTEDQDAKVLADSNDNVITTNSDFAEALLDQEGEQRITLNGEEHILVQETSPVTGWTTYIATPMTALASGASVLGLIILLSAVLGMIIFGAASYGFSTVITKPIFKLTETMKKAREGHLQKNKIRSSSIEINELNQTYNQMVEQTNHLIQVVYEKELIQNRAELKALQAQINPHFLFNTLNALYWLLEEKEESELAEHVITMSELFRYTIANGKRKNEWVTLQDELEHAERYISVMKMRFGERLKWKIILPDQTKTIQIPKLMIQPLVENAIMHGIEGKVKPGEIKIEVAETETDRVMVMVSDDGPGMSDELLNQVTEAMKAEGISSKKGNGVALANVHHRLLLHFAGHETGGLKIDSVEGKGTMVYFELPYYESKGERFG